MDSNALDDALVRKLAALLDETGLNEIEIAQDTFKIRVSKGSGHTLAAAAYPQAMPAAVAAAPTLVEDSANTLCSPMVGNVYLSPKPGAPTFAKEGDSVQQGQTILIVEAMKVMNPIPAHKSGILRKYLVKDAQPVEFGEAMAVIE